LFVELKKHEKYSLTKKIQEKEKINQRGKIITKVETYMR